MRGEVYNSALQPATLRLPSFTELPLSSQLHLQPSNYPRTFRHYTIATMPHHLSNHIHCQDTTPQRCTSIPLSPCVNYHTDSPLGPVSLHLHYPPHKQMGVRLMLLKNTGLVRNTHVQVWSLCHCWKEMWFVRSTELSFLLSSKTAFVWFCCKEVLED
jgi:hypothetical protein